MGEKGFFFRILKNTIVTISILVMIVSVLLNATYLILNTLPNKNKLFSALAAELFHQPIQIKQVEITGYWWQPTVVFEGTTIGRIQLRQLEISLDLWKMIHEKKWVTDQVAIDHLRLRVEENENNNIAVTGFSSDKMVVSKNNTWAKHVFEWVMMQPNIVLSNTDIDLVLKNKKPILINHFNFMIKNHDHLHIISARLNIKQAVPTQVQFIAHVKNEKASLFFEGQKIELSQWIPFLSRYIPIKKIKTVSGLLNLKTWIEINNQHWQHIVSLFSVNDMHVGDFNMSHFSGEINAVPDRGAILLTDKNTEITLPILPLEKLSPAQFLAKLSWMQGKTGWKINLESFKFHNAQWNIFSQLESHFDNEKKSMISFFGDLSVNGTHVESLEGSVANDKNATVSLRGKMRTPLSHLLALQDMTDISGSGDVLCHFNATLPLIGKHKINVNNASITFSKNNIHFLPWNMTLGDLSGTLTLDQGNYDAHSLKANFLGTPLLIMLGGNKNIHVMVQGALDPVQLKKQLDSPFLSLFDKKIPFIAQFTISDLMGNHFSNIAVSLEDLYFLNQRWGVTQLVVNYDPAHISIQIQNKNIAGVVDLNNKNKLMINAKLQHLFLQKNDDKNQSAMFKAMINPASIPALNIHIQDLRINNRDDGQFQFISDPIMKGMIIHHLSFQAPLFQLDGKGYWFLQDDHDETQLSGTVSSSNLGAFLAQRHLSSRLQDGEFSSEFSLQWPGSLQQFSLSKSKGSVEINIKKGRILHLDSDTEANLNIGRVLNLLSMETLSHVLTFDSASIAKSGFPFDYLQGNFQLNQGALVTNDIEMDGSLANIKFDGQISLSNETNNLNMIVYPKVSTSIMTLVGMTAGPIGGAAAWLANKLVSPAVGHLMEMDYQVTGTWNNPVIKRVN